MARLMLRPFGITAAILVCGCGFAGAQPACDPIDQVSLEWHCDPLEIGGVFGNLHFDSRLDRAEGMEVRIVPAECGYQASVQFGVGEGPQSNWSRLLVVDVRFTSELWPLHVTWPALDPVEDTDDFWFSIPAGSGFAGTFYGVIYRDRLEGLFQPIGGDQVRVSLPRIPEGASTMRVPA